MTITELSQNSYEEFLKNTNHYSPFQSPQMAKLLAKRGYQTHFIGLERNNRILVAALLYTIPMTGGLHMEINSGPVSLDTAYLLEFYQELKIYAKDHGALELVIKPYETYQSFDSFGEPISQENQNFINDFIKNGYSHDGLAQGYPGGEPDWHYVKDLTNLSSKDDLIKSFTKKAKPLVKKANSFGIKIKKLSRDELTIFKDITEQTSERREYQDKSLSYYEDFYDSFGDKAEFMVTTINFDDYHQNLESSKQSLLDKIIPLEATVEKQPTSQKKINTLKELKSQLETFNTRLDEADKFKEKYGNKDIAIACALFIFDVKEAVYLFSGSLSEFSKFYAPVLLQEYALVKAISMDIPVYNFLGITGYFDGSDGVLRFKQNFNGFINRKMGTFRYYPSPLKSNIIKVIKTILKR